MNFVLNYYNKINNKLGTNPIVLYAIKFLLIFALLYFFNYGYIGLTQPGNFYSPFLEKHLDYISWLRFSILYTARTLTRALGYNTIVHEPYILSLPYSGSVRMVFDCLGYGVLSFWLAFVIANRGVVLQKIKWAVFGCFFIWFLNCIRIASLLIAVYKGWRINKYMDHHTLFNMFMYILIFLLMFLYSKNMEKFETHENKVSENV